MPVEIKIYHETAQQVLDELQTLSGGLVHQRADAFGPRRTVPKEFGEPSDGAADESGQPADAEPKAAEDKPEPAKRGRKPKKAEEPAPAPEVNADEAQQDAADEAAEMAAKRGDDPAPNHDDLRRALGDYQKKHGMKAAVAAVQPGGLIGMTVDKVPEDRIADVISDLVNAPAPQTETKADPAPDEDPEPDVTLGQLQKSMLAYALKYDGQNTDMKNMPATMADLPQILEDTFGKGVTSVGKIADKAETHPKYAAALAAIEEAIRDNPFDREVKGGA